MEFNKYVPKDIKLKTTGLVLVVPLLLSGCQGSIREFNTNTESQNHKTDTIKEGKIVVVETEANPISYSPSDVLNDIKDGKLRVSFYQMNGLNDMVRMELDKDNPSEVKTTQWAISPQGLLPDWVLEKQPNKRAMTVTVIEEYSTANNQSKENFTYKRKFVGVSDGLLHLLPHPEKDQNITYPKLTDEDKLTIISNQLNSISKYTTDSLSSDSLGLYSSREIYY